MARSCGDNLCTSLPLKEEPKSFWNELFSTIPIGNINVSQRNFTWLIKKFQYGAHKMGVLFPFKGYDFTISTFAEPKNCQTLGNVYIRYASRRKLQFVSWLGHLNILESGDKGPPQVKCQFLISSIFDAMNFQHFSEMLEHNF